MRSESIAAVAVAGPVAFQWVTGPLATVVGQANFRNSMRRCYAAAYGHLPQSFKDLQSCEGLALCSTMSNTHAN